MENCKKKGRPMGSRNQSNDISAVTDQLIFSLNNLHRLIGTDESRKLLRNTLRDMYELIEKPPTSE